MLRPRFLLTFASLTLLFLKVSTAAPPGSSGTSSAASRNWTADNGNGTYSNPLFYEEFEDPDVIRVGEDYYLAGTTMHMNPAVINDALQGSGELGSGRLLHRPARPRSRVSTGGRKHLWERHLGAVHSLPRWDVLCLLKRKRRRPSGVPFQVDFRSLGAQPTSRAARHVGAV